METYAKVLQIAIVYFTISIVIEELVARYKGLKVNRSLDTISSLSSGMTNTLKDMLGLAVVIISYNFMVKYLALFSIESSFLVYFLAFIGIDFASYWSHRFNHEINVMWNRHVVHHSSEEFNLSCALRQSISGIFGVYFFLLIPMALVGIPGEVIAVVGPLHLFAQFWYHTRLINRMGILEKILVTPSHHRVHHSINAEYMDKNYAAILIIWDKIFGTFQEELAEAPCVYGIKRPASTWNPILINFQHFWLLVQDAWRTRNWKDRFLIWFKPTGWRPADVIENYPVYAVEDVYSLEKYDTEVSNGLNYWSWFQLIFHNALIFIALSYLGDLKYNQKLMIGIFLFISIFSYTTLIDRLNYVRLVEFFKFIFGILLLLQLNQWRGESIFSGYGIAFLIYLFVSMSVTIHYSKPHSDEKYSGRLVNG